MRGRALVKVERGLRFRRIGGAKADEVGASAEADRQFLGVAVTTLSKGTLHTSAADGDHLAPDELCTASRPGCARLAQALKAFHAGARSAVVGHLCYHRGRAVEA